LKKQKCAENDKSLFFTMVQSEMNKYVAELEKLSHCRENDVKPLSFSKVTEAIKPTHWQHPRPSLRDLLNVYFCLRTSQQWC